MTMRREEVIKRVFPKQIGDWCGFSNGKMRKSSFFKEGVN